MPTQRREPLPVPEPAKRYEHPGVPLLAAVCRELQRTAGVEPFFLGCRTAAKLVGGVTHATAWRWLPEHDGLIVVVEKADHVHRRATRYRTQAI
jgi:hypothetical protein